jgi:hypothetical protein
MSRVSLTGDPLGTGTFTIASPNSNTDRTLTLPNASGTLNVSGAPNEVPAGSAAAPAIYPAGDTNTGIFFPAADTIAFAEGGAEVARFDASGNFGLKVTPSASWQAGRAVMQIGAAMAFDCNSPTQALVSANRVFTGSQDLYLNSGNATAYQQVNGTHSWFTAPSGTAGNAISFTQAMALDASGNLLVGKTIASDAFVGGSITSGGRVISTMASSSSSESTLHVYSTGAGAYRFFVNLAGVVNATNTTISAISDQRLKENIQDIDVGLDKIMALKPRKYDWKEGKGKDIKGDRGWIAQEFEQVFPDMVDQWLDPAPEGEEPYKSVRADLIPVLVKAVQELKADLDATKAELAALKGQA